MSSPPPSVLGNFFFNGLCNTISSCFYVVFCCWLLQDCFGAPSEPPPVPVSPPQDSFGAPSVPDPPEFYIPPPPPPIPDPFWPPASPSNPIEPPGDPIEPSS